MKARIKNCQNCKYGYGVSHKIGCYWCAKAEKEVPFERATTTLTSCAIWEERFKKVESGYRPIQTTEYVKE